MPTYVSAEKLKEMREELEHRKKVIRKEIADKIAQAKELGDLSENFEYHEAKEQQAQNESRVIALESMIRDAELVETSQGGSSVTLGSRLVVRVNGKEREIELVGGNEADPLTGKISNDSPLGRALVGKKPGVTVEVTAPSGAVSYEIVTIL